MDVISIIIDYILNNSELISLFCLIVSTTVFCYLIPGRIEPLIEKKQNEIDKLDKKIYNLLSDHSEFQNWENRVWIIKVERDILFSIDPDLANDKIQSLIEKCHYDIWRITLHGMYALSARLEYSEEKKALWNQLKIDQLDEIKSKCFEDFSNEFKHAKTNLNNLTIEMNKYKKLKNNITFIITIIQMFAIYLGFISKKT